VLFVLLCDFIRADVLIGWLLLLGWLLQELSVPVVIVFGECLCVSSPVGQLRSNRALCADT
jgi:hypothetical protein